MPWSNAGRTARAEATAALIDEVSLHDADPAAGGDNEVTGGGYARLEPSYGSASNGVVDLVDPLDFSTPANESIHSIGYWSNSTFLGSFPRTSGDTSANAAGEYTVTSAPITAEA